MRAFEVPVAAKSVNSGDVFILDAGLKIYTYIGPTSNAFEKMKGGALAHNLVAARQGKSKNVPEFDDDAWKILGGSPKDIQPPIPDKDEGLEKQALSADKLKLFRLSDASGKVRCCCGTKDGGETRYETDSLAIRKRLPPSRSHSRRRPRGRSTPGCSTPTTSLSSTPGWRCVVVALSLPQIRAKLTPPRPPRTRQQQPQIFVWIGKGASKTEKSQAMKMAMEYLKSENKPATTPITRIIEGQVHIIFGNLVKY